MATANRNLAKARWRATNGILAIIVEAIDGIRSIAPAVKRCVQAQRTRFERA